ncbi:hypothetical protein H0X06_05895 [Candidatus Dependentiae bacterium]|nr:hypothetical protein [Candidatus Dependentiae bacterium]
MTYGVFFSLAGIFIVSMSSVQAVIIIATVRELSNNNRLIVLHDNHKDSEERDLEQLEAAVKALVDREKNTDRPIHILTESAVEEIRIYYANILCSLKTWICCLDDELANTTIESIETRKLSGAVGYILGVKNRECLKEEHHISIDNDFKNGWWVGKIVFNDLYKDFRIQQVTARQTYKDLLMICDSEQEKIYIKQYYNSFMDQAKLEFIKYGDFLKENNIDMCSDQSIYKMVYDWDQLKRDQLDYLLVYCFSPFFDFNAYARIISLHKQSSSLDIVFGAGSNHCWRIETPLINTLPGKQVYSIYNDTLPQGLRGLPQDLIYKLFQAESPAKETPYLLPSFCTLF